MFVVNFVYVLRWFNYSELLFECENDIEIYRCQINYKEGYVIIEYLIVQLQCRCVFWFRNGDSECVFWVQEQEYCCYYICEFKGEKNNCVRFFEQYFFLVVEKKVKD